MARSGHRDTKQVNVNEMHQSGFLQPFCSSVTKLRLLDTEFFRRGSIHITPPALILYASQKFLHQTENALHYRDTFNQKNCGDVKADNISNKVQENDYWHQTNTV